MFSEELGWRSVVEEVQELERLRRRGANVRPIHEFEWSLVDGSDGRHDRRRDLGSERCTLMRSLAILILCGNIVPRGDFPY